MFSKTVICQFLNAVGEVLTTNVRRGGDQVQRAIARERLGVVDGQGQPLLAGTAVAHEDRRLEALADVHHLSAFPSG